jgi:hypothetical protein
MKQGLRTWVTANVLVTEEGFDYKRHIFSIYTKTGIKFLGYIYPDDAEDFENCVIELDNGECPITNKWEDGNGNTVTMNGWGY